MATEIADTKDLVKSLLKRFQALADNGAERDNRRNAVEEMRFAKGEQWPEKIAREREADDRPCITINRVQQMVKQVVNDMRQNRAGLRVHPTGEGSRLDVAELRAGLIRHIEAKSAASMAYVQAAEHAVMAQIGYLRVLPQYESGKSFSQELLVEAIADPLTVYYGDYSRPDASDATECFVITDMPRDDFKRRYPQAAEVPFPAEDLTEADWTGEETVRIGEAFTVEETPDTLFLLQDGLLVLRSELPADPPPEMVVNKRTTSTKKLYWRKITASEVLEETVYDCPYLLIVPVIGEEYVIEGKRYRLSLTRHAMDPQRVYNYARTMTTEQVALAPRAPFILAEGQVEGHEDEWGQANSKNYAYLTYKPQTVAGQLAPTPQRQPFTGVPAGALSDLQLASEEIKAVTGIYDAALGAKGNETSGKAILARQREADNATFHYVDNLNRAILQVGIVLNHLLPVIYDTERIIRILGEDGQEMLTRINSEDGLRLGDGEYDVVLDTGPSYETKRIEAANSMTAFMQAVPNAAPMMADVVAQSMDWPGARKLAKRLEMMLPPEVRQAEAEGAGAVPPQVQQQMGEMQQVIKELQQALQEQLQENEQLQQDQSAEAAKVQIEQRKVAIEDYSAKTERMQVLLTMANQPQPEEGTVEGPSQELVNAFAEQINALREEISQLVPAAAEIPAVQPQPPVVVNMPAAQPQRASRREVVIKAPSGTVYTGVIVESPEGDQTLSLSETTGMEQQAYEPA